MRGRYQVVVKTRKIQYSFWINRNITIIQGDSARGKTVLVDLIREYQENILRYEEKKVTLLVDGAAFGAYVNRVYEKIKANKSTQYTLIMPESFEYLLLRTKLIPVKELNNILLNTWDYVESSEYFSWERYFTDLLTEATKNTIAAYNKDKLNNYYRSDKFYKRVLQECPELAKQFLIERYVNE